MAADLPAVSEQLELAIITYNRSGPLERTLQQFHDSPFADCRITVLDNCSTDDTPAVCERWAGRFRDLRVVRHPYNIGLSPNYLRAVELTRAEYTWVLSDDETYDFSRCEDLLHELRAGEIDLFMLGSPHQDEWAQGLRTTVPDLIARGGRFHNAFTFVAGSIFRTALFDSRAIFRGYQNAANLYPHNAFVQDQFLRGSSVYVTRDVVVVRTRPPINETVGDMMSWLVKWARSCEVIEDPKLRERVINESIGSAGDWARQVLLHTTLTKLDDPDRLPRYLADLWLACRGRQRAVIAACVPLALLPRPVYGMMRRVLRRRRGMAMEDPDFDEFRV